MTTGEVAMKEVIDKSAVLRNLDGDRQLLGELIDIFLAEAGRMLQAVSLAATSQDPVGLSRAAHELKGSVSIFGCPSTAEAALMLETMGRNHDLRNATEGLAKLNALMKNLEEVLHEWRQETCPEP
jgi:two-component system sensor histidine kinase/response regulator